MARSDKRCLDTEQTDRRQQTQCCHGLWVATLARLHLVAQMSCWEPLLYSCGGSEEGLNFWWGQDR